MTAEILVLTAGLILIATSVLNIVFFDRTVQRLMQRGKKPTENAQRLNKFFSVVTFMIGLYITFGTINNMK